MSWNLPCREISFGSSLRGSNLNCFGFISISKAHSTPHTDFLADHFISLFLSLSLSHSHTHTLTLFLIYSLCQRKDLSPCCDFFRTLNSERASLSLSSFSFSLNSLPLPFFTFTHSLISSRRFWLILSLFLSRLKFWRCLEEIATHFPDNEETRTVGSRDFFSSSRLAFFFKLFR